MYPSEENASTRWALLPQHSPSGCLMFNARRAAWHLPLQDARHSRAHFCGLFFCSRDSPGQFRCRRPAPDAWNGVRYIKGVARSLAPPSFSWNTPRPAGPGCACLPLEPPSAIAWSGGAVPRCVTRAQAARLLRGFAIARGMPAPVALRDRASAGAWWRTHVPSRIRWSTPGRRRDGAAAHFGPPTAWRRLPLGPVEAAGAALPA